MLRNLLRKDKAVRDDREIKAVTTRLDSAERRLTLIELEVKVLKGDVK